MSRKRYTITKGERLFLAAVVLPGFFILMAWGLITVARKSAEHTKEFEVFGDVINSYVELAKSVGEEDWKKELLGPIRAKLIVLDDEMVSRDDVSVDMAASTYAARCHFELPERLKATRPDEVKSIGIVRVDDERMSIYRLMVIDLETRKCVAAGRLDLRNKDVVKTEAAIKEWFESLTIHP